MKNILLVLMISILPCSSYAQSLKFDKKYYHALDHWVVLEGTGNPKKHLLGFVYLDEQDGISLRHEGSILAVNGKLELIDRQDTAIILSRLDNRTVDLAILTAADLAALKLPVEPYWLSVFKANEDKISYQVAKGRWLNAAEAVDLALPVLLAAYAQEPHAPGLEFELAYAYNHMGSFYKAIVILNKALEVDPDNFWYYRELGFSLKHLNKLKEAEEAYRKGIAINKDAFQNAEMAINMVQSFFHVKDKAKFDEWKEVLKQYAEPESMFLEYLAFFESNWEMERK